MGQEEVWDGEGPTRKVTCFVVLPDERARLHVCLFRHELAGIQFPAGTVERGESFPSAARREAWEETLLSDFGEVRLIARRREPDPGGDRDRAFFLMPLRSVPPFRGIGAQWETRFDGPLFRPFWAPVDALPEIEPPQDGWVAFLFAGLESAATTP